MFFRHVEPEQAPLLASAVVTACAKDGWADPFQPEMLAAIFDHVLGYTIDFAEVPVVSIDEVRAALPSAQERIELIDLMVAMEILCNPIPLHLSDSVDSWAAGLGVVDDEIEVARALARGETARATADFIRHTYTATANAQNPDFERLLDQYGQKAINFTVEADPSLAARYQALENCEANTLGRVLWEFYTDRGFGFPGEIGAANLSLAHHDWGHVIYDYGTTGIGEVEAAGFRAVSSNFRGVGLQFFGDLMFYQSALLSSLVTGLHPRGELQVPNASCRIADAIRRGRVCTLDPYDPALDFFDHVNENLDTLRERWNVVPKRIGEDCTCRACNTAV